MANNGSHNYMSTKQFLRIYYGGLAAILIVTASALMITVHHLDQNTRKQCATQNWPASMAAAHKAFCKAYLNN